MGGLRSGEGVEGEQVGKRERVREEGSKGKEKQNF